METEAGFVLSIEISIYLQFYINTVNCSDELTKSKCCKVREGWHQLPSCRARLTAAEPSADRQDFSVPWLHTAGAVTGFVPNAGAVQDRKCRAHLRHQIVKSIW